MDTHDMLTSGAAARQLGISITRLKALEADGRIVAAGRLGTWRMYRRADVQRLAAERAAKAAK